MRKRNISIIVGFIIAVIIALWYIRKNPVAAQIIQDNLPVELPDMILPTGNDVYNIDIPGYIPRDIPLPAINDGAGYTGRREIGTTCNFCLLARPRIEPAAVPRSPAPPLTQPYPIHRAVGGFSPGIKQNNFPNFNFALGYMHDF